MAEIRNTVAEALRTGLLNEPGFREPEDLLRGLGLLREGVQWRAAAVLFGNPERLEFELSQCLLRVARFRGIDRSDFLDNRQFNGNAFVLLSQPNSVCADTDDAPQMVTVVHVAACTRLHEGDSAQGKAHFWSNGCQGPITSRYASPY